jgi:uncharacterized protein YydD (DUF2326 family)
MTFKEYLYLPHFNDCIYDPTLHDLLYDLIIYDLIKNEYNEGANDLLTTLIYYKLDFDKITKDFCKIYIADFNRWIKENKGLNCNLKIKEISKNYKNILIELQDKYLRKTNIAKLGNNFGTYDTLQTLSEEYNSTADLAIAIEDLQLSYKTSSVIDTMQNDLDYKQYKDKDKARQVLLYVDSLK